MKKIDFRKNGKQRFYGFGGEEIIEYRGKCPITGTRLYESNISNDSRGILGNHAIHHFIASEYNMIGPDMIASWIACNNDELIYLRALNLAKKIWKEKRDSAQ